MKTQSLYNYSKDDDFEYNSHELVTIPDQSLSVREILTRFTRSGLELPSIESGEDDDINESLVSDFFEAQQVLRDFDPSVLIPASPSKDPGDVIEENSNEVAS